MSLAILSSAFSNGQVIPRKHTGDGEDLSPPLAWSGVPEGAKELALICDDPDAPTPEPWVHWLIYKIPPTVQELPEGVPASPSVEKPFTALQGRNSWPSGQNVGYRGPAPPRGHGVHHYHFKLYALSSALALKPGADKRALLAAMAGQVLAEAEIVGTYKR